MKKTFDWFLALTCAVFAGGGLYFVTAPGIAPSVWTDAAVAFGTRPPADFFPGLWRCFMMALRHFVPAERLLTLVPVLGSVFLALIAFMAYFLLRGTLTLFVKMYPRHQIRLLRLIGVSALCGTVAFVTCDPLWRSAQAGGSLCFNVFLLFLAMGGLALFARSGRTFSLYVAAFLAGVLTAETPYAVLPTLGGTVIYWFVEKSIIDFSGTQLLRRRTELVRWKATILFVFGFLLSMSAIMGAYVLAGGLEANGLAPGQLALTYFNGWAAQFTASATAAGWLFASVLIVVPFFLVLFMFRPAADEELFLPYRDGLLFCVTGLLALSQLSAISELWIWNWTERALISSPQLRLFVLALASLTLTMGVAVLSIYAFCRAHDAHQRIYVYEESENGPRLADGGLSKRWRARQRLLYGFVALAVLLFALVANCWSSRSYSQRVLIEAYLDETMREAEGCTDLFTDGRFDDALRLRALFTGRNLKPRGLYLQQTAANTSMLVDGVTRGETALAARQGPAAYLRTLIRDFPEDATNAAFQVGFEQWRRDLRAAPPAGGVMARYAWAPGKREASIAAAKELAGRVRDYYVRFGKGMGNDRDAFGYLETVQWRLARMAVLRSEQRDLANDSAGAVAEKKLADDLDSHNASFQRIQDDVIRAERLSPRAITPREALDLALRKADFGQARFYAEQVLVREPTNRPANFAVGMAFAEKGEYTQAVEHLAKAIAPGSKDPVLYNNLAMAQLAVGQFAAARTNAMHAVKLAPKVSAVRDTLKRIDEAERAAATNKAPSAASVRLKRAPARLK